LAKAIFRRDEGGLIMKLYHIAIQDNDTFYPYGPFLVEEEPTQEELKRLKEKIGTNVKCTVKEVEFPKCLDDILQKSDWVICAAKEDLLSYYVSSTTGDPSQNTWTKNIKGATTFNAVAARKVESAFVNHGRLSYYAKQLP